MTEYSLPEPGSDGLSELERTIGARKSRRSFADEPVGIETVATLLWSVQGLTHERDAVAMRASPSAGATFPMVAFLSVAPGGCDDLEAGLYRYVPDEHRLDPAIEESIHEDLTAAALDQAVVRGAPATIALAADYDRTTRQYPDHGDRYVHMEAGHAAQNALLVCESRGLNACPVGAFDDAELTETLALPDELDPLYLVPVGRRPTDR